MINFLKITMNSSETLQEVRKQLLNRILIISNVLGIPIVVIGLTEALILDQLLAAFSYLFFFSPILIALILRNKIHYKLSAALILFSTYFIAVFNLIIYGFSGAAIPIFLTFLVFTSVFFDLKKAFFAVLISLLPMGIVGYLFLNNTLSLDINLSELSSQPIAWFTSFSVLLFLGSLIVLTYGIIQKKMLHSLDFIKQQRNELKLLNLQLEKDILKRKKIEEELKNNQDNLETIVKDRTKKLEERNKELEEYNDLFIGREFRIKELREEIKKLKK